MKTIQNKIERKTYSRPQIECVKLDHEISLALASNPPEGPGESLNAVPNSFYNNPYKNSLV